MSDEDELIQENKKNVPEKPATDLLSGLNDSIQNPLRISESQPEFDNTNFRHNLENHLSSSNTGFDFNASKSTENPDWSMNGSYSKKGNLYNVNITTGVNQSKEGISYSETVNAEYHDECLTIAANVTDNNGTVNGGASVNLDNENYGIRADYNINEEGNPTHNIDAHVTTTLDESDVTIGFHNERTDTSVTINNGKRPLLRRNNNPNSKEEIYQLQKEGLMETGEALSVALQCGSDKDIGFYTSNSILANLGNGNFINFKLDISKYQNSTELMTDLKKLILQYKNEIGVAKETADKELHSIDFSLKGSKNIYSASWSVETQNSEENGPVRNVSFGAKATLNRTQFGEFESGLNGELEAQLTQQGYKYTIDGAYNYYGCEHNKTNDYMFSTKTTLEHNAEGINLESGLYTALRFNNCKTIIEPHSIFELKKDTQGHIERTYRNGIGIYQQLGKNFEDLVGYVQGERVIFNGGNAKNYSQLTAGVRKKASDKITLNAEANWNSNEKPSGKIGIIYNL